MHSGEAETHVYTEMCTHKACARSPVSHEPIFVTYAYTQHSGMEAGESELQGCLGVMAHAFSPSIWETEARRFL